MLRGNKMQVEMKSMSRPANAKQTVNCTSCNHAIRSHRAVVDFARGYASPFMCCDCDCEDLRLPVAK